MILVIGGCFQGQKEFADSLAAPENKVVSDVHLFIKEGLKNGKSREEIEKELFPMPSEEDARILVGDEIGYGIVPMDPFDREYREAVGRIMCHAAGRAEKVYRVVAGIPSRIK